MSCRSCCKGFLGFIIFLNWLIGLAIVGVALWAYYDGEILWKLMYGFNNGPLIAEIKCFSYVMYAMMALGSLKTAVSGITCCNNTTRKSFVPVFLLFGVQIAAGVCVWYFKDDFTAATTKSLTRLVSDDYASMNTTDDYAIDKLQAGLKCCGSDSPSNWAASVYNDDGGDPSVYMVPQSCCLVQDLVLCEGARAIKDNIIPPLTIFSRGCSEPLLEPIYEYVFRYETLGIAAAYVFIEFLLMTIKLFGCRKRYEDYEDAHMMELKPYR